MFIPWPELARRFERALDKLGSANPGHMENLRASSFFFFLQHVIERMRRDDTPRPLLLITETTIKAEQLRQFLSVADRLVFDREPRDGDYLVFPDYEPQNLFEYTDPGVDVVEARNRVLEALLSGSARAVVASYKACFRKLPEPEEFTGRKLLLASAASASGEYRGEISREELSEKLTGLGYHSVSTVTRVGEFALRGGLVDVFPVGRELPLRIDLFGDEIESLAEFNPENQRTEEQVQQVQVLPLSTHISHFSNPDNLDVLRAQWEAYAAEYRNVLPASSFERISEVVENDIDLLSGGIESPRAGWYYRATCSGDSCLWHYLPQGAQVVAHEEGFIDSETKSYFHFWQQRFQDWIKNGLGFLSMDWFYLKPSGDTLDVLTGITNGQFTFTTEDGPVEVAVPAPRVLLTHGYSAGDDKLPRVDVRLDNAPTSGWSTSKLAQSVLALPQVKLAEMDLGDWAARHKLERPVTILSQFSGRLREVLEDDGAYAEVENAVLPGGFIIPPAPAPPDAPRSPFPVEWTVVTDAEVFGEIGEVGTAAVRRYRQEAVRSKDELTPGDYIVHIDYGIGRFAHFTEREIHGVQKSYIEIEYAGRDRLYVPVEQLDRIRRYSYDGTEPKLSSLGRDTWRKTKERVRQDTIELAKKLLSLYKTRAQREGYKYPPQSVWEQEFAEGFPYNLTEDQLQAWKDVESDMEAVRPMDRLLCGDVGFGKTEIALRATFKACVDERQVLVLCPTTVLADQHYRTFTRRFRPFPFRVAQLSRFQSKAEQKDVVVKLREGRIDVVIATHRALSKDVGFERLGLLVIDEEQRFGVKQKEKLRMRFPDVDVLAMSATPIPRTLHMSLIGLRDISLIETPPVERKPVKTYVGEHDDVMIREAILRELGRGGQVYYLHNRVQDIEKVKEQLERLVSGEKVVVAHGQMREDRLEEVMHAFSLGAYKIMLSTTIIENGLDIPSVNTIILTHAENLGLAQMHQLRGRVGRSSVQAYAYFFHRPNRILTEEAQNRLHAIYNYAYLGSGYEIAQSDLRIRGAGNLLGEAQSGLAKAVGFEYYCELLTRSINDVKALDEADIEDWEDTPLSQERPGAQVDLPLPSYIPESYISDPVLRLEVLRDLAAINSEETLEDFALELADRFGDPPPEVENLLIVVRIRNLAGVLGIQRISYNRGKRHFALRMFEHEQPWYKRAQLVDSRFESVPQPGQLILNLEFTGQETGEELYEALKGLTALKR